MYHPQYQYAAPSGMPTAVAPVPVPQQQRPAPRQYSSTSSAFSPSAHPDEDWTKISDLAERRRIQNRIAQRNYRKKLKSRLQELEKRAGSDGKPNPSKKSSSSSSKSSKSPKPVSATTTPPMSAVPTFITTPPQMPEDVFPSIERDSRSASPMFPSPGSSAAAYSPPSTYPSLDDQGYLTAPSYGYPVCTMGASSYSLPATGIGATTGLGAMVSLPAMCGSPGMDAGLDTLATTHAELAGGYYVPSIELTGASGNGYDGYQATTPPLSHSFDHSATCSESEYTYPTTPLSMPSPGMIQ